ncbi:MAG: 2-dehydropantoate 2-reductase [Candidatus Dormibacteraeota bacterium]|nr:2-dehydropantoate 2-reductase [Candidatus Dormibacteraeota bacterium]
MKHAVLGAGGVGGLVGAALARAGHEVLLLVRGPHPRRLTVESTLLGNFEAAIEAVGTLETAVDVLWVATKAVHLPAALRVAPARFVRGTVVPLLNGYDHVALLRDDYPVVTPGVIRVEAERPERGQIRQLGPFIRMELSGVLAGEIVTELREAGVDAKVNPDEVTMLWGKLAMLAPMAMTTTAAGRPVGGVREDPQWRAHLVGILEEAVAVGRAAGANLDGGAALGALLGAPAGMRTSMQKDREAGRPLELDAVAGPIMRGGRRSGISTPHTDELVRLLRER